MRYRKLDANGDMTFGRGTENFHMNQPEAVAQAVRTRLWLYLGEWFTDTSDGTDWNSKVLGPRTQATRDAVLRDRILGTPGVRSIIAYSSGFDHNTRTFMVNVTLDTIYGATPQLNLPVQPGRSG